MPPKGTLDDKATYSIINCHDDTSPRQWNGDHYRVISCDPGHTSLGFCIMDQYLNGYCRVIALERFSIKSSRMVDNVPHLDHFRLLTNCFNRYAEHHSQCHYVIVEKQVVMSRANEKIMNAILMYYTIHLANLPLRPFIIKISAHLKGKMLNFGRTVDIKRASIVRARDQMLMYHDPAVYLLKADTKKQGEDMSDAYNQARAFFLHLGLFQLSLTPLSHRDTLKLFDNLP
jgi:hypothetical protein